MLVMSLMGGYGAPAVADLVTAPLPLSITLQSKVPAKQAALDEDGWQEVCKRWGESMRVGKGPGGIGIFASYSCRSLGQGPAQDWSLSFLLDKKNVRIAIKYKKKTLAKFRFPIAGKLLLILNDPQVRELTVAGLLDQLPMLVHVNPKTYKNLIESAGAKKSASSQDGVDTANLVVYRLYYQEKSNLWRAEFIDAPKALNASTALIDGAKVPLGEAHLWAHRGAGRGAVAKNMAEQLNAAFAAAEKALKLEPPPPPPPLPEDNDLLEMSGQHFLTLGYGAHAGDHKIFGPGLGQPSFAYEYRSDGLYGVRLDGVMMPTAQHNQASFGEQRFTCHVLIPFSVAENQSYILEIVPKLGVAKLKAQVPLAELSEDEDASELDSKQMLVVGFGLAHHIRWSLLRLSYFGAYYSRAFAGVDLDRISLIHAGLSIWPDATYFTLSPTSKLAMELFVENEYITVEKSLDEAGLKNHSSLSLTYNLSFLFAGLRLSYYWH